MKSFVLGIAVTALALGGCGAAPAPSDPAFGDAPVGSGPSAAGQFVVTVWSSPDPIARGLDAVRYRISTSDGAPVDAAGVTATPWMPAHGHGTSVVPSVTPLGDGVYEIDRVLFFMSGRWELRSEITAPDGARDALVTVFDVP